MIVAEVLSLVQGMGMDLDNKETEALEYDRMSIDIIFTFYGYAKTGRRKSVQGMGPIESASCCNRQMCWVTLTATLGVDSSWKFMP